MSHVVLLSGKSSLTVALFRLVEIESGEIFLDGVDLSRLGLSDVRGRKNGMSIIPQVFTPLVVRFGCCVLCIQAELTIPQTVL